MILERCAAAVSTGFVLLHCTWSAFGTKRTSRHAQPMSLSGVKRTLAATSPMSAYDPKRTYALQQAAAYSITSSARASMVAGIVRPSALAVLRLTTKSNLVGSPAHRSALRLSVYASCVCRAFKSHGKLT